MERIYFSLDDSSLKAQLKAYIASQTEFKSYNFDASNLNQLLDILIPMVKQLSFNTGMGLNEIFIGTISLRKNIIAVAKMLGYLPNRKISSVGKVVAQDSNVAGGNTLVVSAGSVFTIGGISFYVTDTVNFTSAAGVFTTWSSITAYVVGNKVIYNDVAYVCTVNNTNKQPDTETSYWEETDNTLATEIDVIQGISSSTIYNYLSTEITDVSGNIHRIKLPYNDEIASNAQFTVEVKIGALGSYEVWENARTRDTAIGNTSTNGYVYWLKEIDNNLYIYFGDGTVGVNIPAVVNNNIRITYTISNGIDGNVLTTPTAPSISPSSSGTFNYRVDNDIIGGRERETVEEIRANAPLFYNSANRCVIDDDYIVNLKDGGITNVNSWGGESEMFSIANTEWLARPYNSAFIGQSYVVGNVVSINGKSLYKCAVNDTLTVLNDVWNAHSSSWNKYGHLDLGKIYITGIVASELGNTYYNSTQYDNMWNNIIGSKRPTSMEVEYIDPSELFMDMTINVYYKDILLDMPSVYDSLIENFVVTTFNSKFRGFNKNFYSGYLISEIIRNFSVVENVTIIMKPKLRIPFLTQYNPQHSVNTVYKRIFNSFSSASFIKSSTWSVDSNNKLQHTSYGEVGILYPTEGIVEIYNKSHITEDLNIRFTMINSGEILSGKELYIDRGEITIFGRTITT